MDGEETNVLAIAGRVEAVFSLLDLAVPDREADLQVGMPTCLRRRRYEPEGVDRHIGRRRRSTRRHAHEQAHRYGSHRRR
jgi:hypothetical protein